MLESNPNVQCRMTGQSILGIAKALQVGGAVLMAAHVATALSEGYDPKIHGDEPFYFVGGPCDGDKAPPPGKKHGDGSRVVMIHPTEEGIDEPTKPFVYRVEGTSLIHDPEATKFIRTQFRDSGRTKEQASPVPPVTRVDVESSWVRLMNMVYHADPGAHQAIRQALVADSVPEAIRALPPAALELFTEFAQTAIQEAVIRFGNLA